MSQGEEMLIVVDANDTELGSKSREECHAGEGILHRAITVLLFNARGEILLTRRSASKTLWPGWWDTSCSTHVHHGETYKQAGEQRVPVELGVTSTLKLITKFVYQAPFGASGSENELCALLIGECIGDPTPNPQEVSEMRWIPVPTSIEGIDQGKEYTPWLTVALKKYLETQ